MSDIANLVGKLKRERGGEKARLAHRIYRIPKLENTVIALYAEVKRCHARLEIDHVFQLNGEEMERVEVPMGERSSIPDGIENRDCTIEILEDNNARLRASLKEIATGRNANGEAVDFPADTARKALEERLATE